MIAPFPRADKEFDSSDDHHNTEQLAKQLVTSAVIDYTGGNPNVPSTLSDEYRVDYTDEVRKKYFDLQEKNETNLSHRFALPQKERFHKMDEGIPSKIIANNPYIPVSNQSSLSSKGGGFYTKSTNDNASTKKIQRGDGPHTPPLTLYSNEGMPPLTLSSRASPNTPSISKDDDDSHNHHILGYLSPMSGMDIDSVGQNAQTGDTLTRDLHSVSDYTQPGGSLYSTASSRGSLIKRPVLYSAIGSLEHANNNSLTNLNKRFLAPSKEFCQPGGILSATKQSRLIPPVRQYQHGQFGQRKSNASSSLETEMSRQNLQTSREKDQGEIRPNKSVVGDNSGIEKPGDANNPLIPAILPDNKSYSRKCPSGEQTNIGNAPTKEKTTKTKRNVEKNTNRRDSQNKNQRRGKSSRKVSIDASVKIKKSKPKTVEMFRPSSDAYTPRIERKKIEYKAAEARPCVQQMSSPMGTLQRPNFRDALRRVAMIIHQHIVKIESRFEKQGGEYNRSNSRRKGTTDDGLFHASMRDMFHEDSYRTPTYKCNMARIPMARPGMIYGLRKIKVIYEIPSETEIYNFGHQLFKSVQLSSECSIVCLIYVERLMEVANVPLLACTWRPIFMCGLLLASKVWQDLSSWNIEFSSVYPLFSLESINKLELNFLRNVKWDLYISSR